MSEKCFVVMAIGPQQVGDQSITSQELRENYENVIKVAIERARPGIEVERTDDCYSPGTISTDILTHLMFDTFVIVDVTFPNPNVFYELGVRHACRPGTFLIRNKSFSIQTPFDISHQRHFEYDGSAKGATDLSVKLREYFSWYDKNEDVPDNQLLQLARQIKFSFPQYGTKKLEKLQSSFGDLLGTLLSSPEMLQVMVNPNASEGEKRDLMIKLMTSNPEVAKKIFLEAMRPD